MDKWMAGVLELAIFGESRANVLEFWELIWELGVTKAEEKVHDRSIAGVSPEYLQVIYKHRRL